MKLEQSVIARRRGSYSRTAQVDWLPRIFSENFLPRIETMFPSPSTCAKHVGNGRSTLSRTFVVLADLPRMAFSRFFEIEERAFQQRRRARAHIEPKDQTLRIQ